MVAANFFGDSKKMRFICPQTACTSPLRVSTFLPAYARSSTKRRHQWHRGGGGFDEADLPKPYTQTQAVVTKPDTPTAVLRMAGGLHQRAHRSHEETIFSEIIGSLAKRCEQRGGKS